MSNDTSICSGTLTGRWTTRSNIEVLTKGVPRTSQEVREAYVKQLPPMTVDFEALEARVMTRLNLTGDVLLPGVYTANVESVTVKSDTPNPQVTVQIGKVKKAACQAFGRPTAMHLIKAKSQN